MRLWAAPAEPRRLYRALREHMEAQSILESAAEACVPGPAVTLPGFGLLDSVEEDGILAMLLPSKLDLQDLVHGYESFVDTSRKMHRNWDPDRVMLQCLRIQPMGRLFLRTRSPQQWFEPLSLLIATIAIVGETPLEVEPGSVCTVNEIGRFHAVRGSAWSNVHERFQQFNTDCTDWAMKGLQIDAFATDHPLARALVQVEASQQAQRYLSTLLQGMRVSNKLRDPSLLLGPEAEQLLRHPGRPRGTKARRESSQIQAAVAEALHYLDLNEAGVAEELVRVLAPKAMSPSEARRLIGRPVQSERPFSPRVVERIRDSLNELTGL